MPESRGAGAVGPTASRFLAEDDFFARFANRCHIHPRHREGISIVRIEFERPIEIDPCLFELSSLGIYKADAPLDFIIELVQRRCFYGAFQGQSALRF